MKNKEEPSANSTAREPLGQVDLYFPDDVGTETTGSLSRPGRTASASVTQPALKSVSRDPDGERRRCGQHGTSLETGPVPTVGPPGLTVSPLTNSPSAFRSPLARDSTAASRWHLSALASATKAIDKPDGGQRLLGIPNVHGKADPASHRPSPDPDLRSALRESSFGFRPGRSAHGAAKQVQHTIRRGHRFSADIDLSKFFDRVQHDVLMTRVARRVKDKFLLRLIGRYLRAGVMVEGVLQPTDVEPPRWSAQSDLK